MDDNAQAQEARKALTAGRRVVVKVGTRVIVDDDARPDPARIAALAAQIAALRGLGKEVVLVTSGAIGAGLEALGRRTRPTSLPELQMTAAVGQTRLMNLYQQAFAPHGLHLGQVLLTHEGLRHRERHLNARNTLNALLHHGIVPVVNENDAVATEEIRFGDNDLLGALVALLVHADTLCLLTTVDGLHRGHGTTEASRIPFLSRLDPAVTGLASGKGGDLSTGGMGSKLEAARMAARGGSLVLIADGRQADVLSRAYAGEDVGTLLSLGRAPRRLRTGRLRWIAFFHRTQGTLRVDAGAADSLRRRGTSLLPIGVRKVEGTFGRGAVVDVAAPDGEVVARGLSNFAADELARIAGRRTGDIASVLGHKDFDEAIHRDNMVIFHDHPSGAGHEPA